MPAALKIILNIGFYILYVIVFSLIAWLMYALIKWGVIDLNDSSFYNKFWIIMIFSVLTVTILLKKYFYISLVEKEEIVVIED